MDEPKPEMFELYLESEERFAEQFDPCSDTFHRGDPTPVPVGGERIPESMPTVYDNSGGIRDIPMDPTYYYLSEARSVLLDLKKILSQICPAVEAINRASKFRDLAKKNAALMERQSNLFDILEKIKVVAGQLTQYGELVPNYNEVLGEIYQRCLVDNSEKIVYEDFVRFVNAFTQKVFKDSQGLMQKMKMLS